MPDDTTANGLPLSGSSRFTTIVNSVGSAARTATLPGSAASELARYAPRNQVVARDQEFESDPGGDKDLTDLATARLHQQEVAAPWYHGGTRQTL